MGVVLKGLKVGMSPSIRVKVYLVYYWAIGKRSTHQQNQGEPYTPLLERQGLCTSHVRYAYTTGGTFNPDLEKRKLRQ